MKIYIKLLSTVFICMTLSGCANDLGGQWWWMLIGFPAMGILYMIYSEITRPRPTKQRNEEILKVLKRYQNAGYRTYHVSVHKPELFFIYLDKGKDENSGPRTQQRVYVDIYKKRAYNEWTGENLPLPIPF